MKKMKGDCQLVDLEDVRKRFVDAKFIKQPAELDKILADGFAATAASNNGAFNVWKGDFGALHGSHSIYCRVIEKTTFKTMPKAKRWVKKKLIEIQ